MVKKTKKRVTKKLKKLIVKKRNGKLEDFSKKKINDALKLAGTATKDANKIVDLVALHAKKVAKQGIVTAVEVERSVVNFLVKRNREVTENFKKVAKKW